MQGARLETRIFNSQISSKVRTIKVYDPMKIFDIVKLSRSNISLDLDTYILFKINSQFRIVCSSERCIEFANQIWKPSSQRAIQRND